MKRFLTAAFAAAFVFLGSSAAVSADFTPSVVFDMGGKFDKSFNQAAFDGAERFKKETGISYREFEVTSPTQREQAIRNMAKRGANVVVGIGFAQAAAIEKAAKEFPKTKIYTSSFLLKTQYIWMIKFKKE